jgi:hypothetical protein
MSFLHWRKQRLRRCMRVLAIACSHLGCWYETAPVLFPVQYGYEFMKIALAVICALAFESLHAADSWAFDPNEDAFRPEAAEDLRALNEHVAGEKGFVRRSTDGNEFLLGDGTSARFWAINFGCEKAQVMARQAKFLAKRGVNLVRLSALVHPDLKKHPNARMDEINLEALHSAR